MKNSPKIVDKGDWGHSSYTAVIDPNTDTEELKDKVTGVVAVCFDEKDKVILMNNEPLGGHLEPNESIKEALKREVLEEGGMELKEWKPYGYYKIIQKENAPAEFKQRYPKISYILFYLARGKYICKPFGKDVISVQRVDPKKLLQSGNIRHKMLFEGVKLYLSRNGNRKCLT